MTDNSTMHLTIAGLSLLQVADGLHKTFVHLRDAADAFEAAGHPSEASELRDVAEDLVGDAGPRERTRLALVAIARDRGISLADDNETVDVEVHDSFIETS